MSIVRKVFEDILACSVVGMILSFLAVGLPRMSVGLTVILNGEPMPEGAAPFAFGSAFIAMLLSFMIAWFVAQALKSKPDTAGEERKTA